MNILPIRSRNANIEDNNCATTRTSLTNIKQKHSALRNTIQIYEKDTLNVISKQNENIE